MIVQPRSGRIAITWADTSRELASFTYEMKGTYAMGFRSPIKRSTLADANESRDRHIWSINREVAVAAAVA